MTDKPTPREGEILLYTGPAGDIRVEVLFEEESFWLTQKRMAERMAEWAKKLDAFLAFNDYEIFKDAGKISHAVAKALAEREYEAFRVAQDRSFESDFEREAQRVTAKPGRRKKPEGN